MASSDCFELQDNGDHGNCGGCGDCGDCGECTTLERFRRAMRNYTVARSKGETPNEPTCRCDHWHSKREIPCKHAGNPFHDRTQCEFDHEYYDTVHGNPTICRHDGQPYHDEKNCKFLHLKSIVKKQGQKEGEKKPEDKKVVSPPAPPAPLSNTDDWVTLPSKGKKVKSSSPSTQAPATQAPTKEILMNWAEVAEQAVQAEQAKMEKEEVEKDLELDAEIARLEAEVAKQEAAREEARKEEARKVREQKLAKIAALKAQLNQ